MYKIPLEDHGTEMQLINEMIEQRKYESEEVKRSSPPSIYFGQFILPNNITAFPPPDTFLDLDGWFKVNVDEYDQSAY
jgi:hypothetical protein